MRRRVVRGLWVELLERWLRTVVVVFRTPDVPDEGLSAGLGWGGARSSFSRNS